MKKRLEHPSGYYSGRIIKQHTVRKDLKTMEIKKLVINGAVVLALGALLISGCAKPPTEKVDALKTDVAALTEQGAQQFAATEFDAVNTKMAELENLMTSKKYKDAAALADSLTAQVAAVKSAVETNGQQLTTAEVASANEEVAKLKALSAASAKALGADAQKYTDQVTALESQAAGLQAQVDNKQFLAAFNAAKSIKDQTAAATAEITAKAEAAKPAGKPAKAEKAAKGEKAAKPAKK
jgi:hypothetical protein